MRPGDGKNAKKPEAKAMMIATGLAFSFLLLVPALAVGMRHSE